MKFTTLVTPVEVPNGLTALDQYHEVGPAPEKVAVLLVKVDPFTVKSVQPELGYAPVKIKYIYVAPPKLYQAKSAIGALLIGLNVPSFMEPGVTAAAVELYPYATT